ncbi:MAG: DUF2231 domain-containing protein [Actinomycetota bacterium]
MPSNVFGLPTHILLIHAVVVLLPIAAVLTVLAACLPSFRRRYGLAILLFTFATTLSVPLAAQSGENLLSRLPETAQRLHHATLGKQLEIVTALFGLALFALLVLDLYRRAGLPDEELGASERWLRRFVPADRRAPRGRERAGTAVFRGAQVLAVTLAVVVVAMTFLAGDSGARAVWSAYPHLAATPTSDGG